MYRAFIVDDEPAMIEGLKLLIPWGALGFTLCGEASSAQEALSKLTIFRPHLVITDIRMPMTDENVQPAMQSQAGLKDGIDLIEETRRLEMYTEFIILSGYPNFNYAQKAIDHNVKRYLLKPLDQDELIETLQCIKKHLDEQFLARYGLAPEDIEAFSHNGNAPDENENAKTAISQDFDADFDSNLASAVELIDLPKAIDLVECFFTWMTEQNIAPQKAYILINSCVYILLHIAFDRNIQMELDASMFFAHQPLPEHGQWKRTKQALLDIVTKLIYALSDERRKRSRLYLYEVKEYIDQHYHHELSVSFLAKSVFVDAVYLGRAFRMEFGCTINEYQHRLRIEEAADLIIRTDQTLCEISAAVGYQNYNNFYAHFERITGKKPAEYKENAG